MPPWCSCKTILSFWDLVSNTVSGKNLRKFQFHFPGPLGASSLSKQDIERSSAPWPKGAPDFQFIIWNGDDVSQEKKGNCIMKICNVKN